MLKVSMSNPALSRTIRPLYANTQATPWGGFLDPENDATKPIYPGSVMARQPGTEVFELYTGATGQVPFGLSALFVAPLLGVDEMTESGTNLFTVWVGDGSAAFEILGPAFDQSATWDETVTLLTGNSDGLLTPTGATSENAIAELIEVVSEDKIVVRPFRPTPSA